jgi:hypothetical protein
LVIHISLEFLVSSKMINSGTCLMACLLGLSLLATSLIELSAAPSTKINKMAPINDAGGGGQGQNQQNLKRPFPKNLFAMFKSKTGLMGGGAKKKDVTNKHLNKLQPLPSGPKDQDQLQQQQLQQPPFSGGGDMDDTQCPHKCKYCQNGGVCENGMCKNCKKHGGR